MPDSVICRSQIEKYGNGFLLYLKKILNVLVRLDPRLTFHVKTQPAFFGSQPAFLDHWFDTGIDKSFENLVGDTVVIFVVNSMGPSQGSSALKSRLQRSFLDLGNFDSAQTRKKKSRNQYFKAALAGSINYR